MYVDDHAINSLKVFYSVACDHLKSEWDSGSYSNLSECPSFKEVYTYQEALDVLYRGPERIDEDKTERLLEIIEAHKI